MLNVFDIAIIIVIMLCAFIGYNRGFIKQGVITVGTILVVVLSFMLKNPISLFMYKNLPFLDLNFIVKNSTVLNILIYEIIAFLTAFSVLEVVLIILIRVSSVIEKVLRVTPFLSSPNGILGLILGAIEGYVIAFIVLFIMSITSFAFGQNKSLKKSVLKPIILKNTIVFSDFTEDTTDTIDEISELIEFKDDYSAKEFDCEALSIMIDKNFLDKKSARYLYNHDKISSSCDIFD